MDGLETHFAVDRQDRFALTLPLTNITASVVAATTSAGANQADCPSTSLPAPGTSRRQPCLPQRRRQRKRGIPDD